MKNQLVLHGSNLNRRGSCEPVLFNRITLNEISRKLHEVACGNGANVLFSKAMLKQQWQIKIRLTKQDGIDFIINFLRSCRRRQQRPCATRDEYAVQFQLQHP